MRYRMALILALSLLASAQAATYEWVDNQGVVHFTDDLDKIPANYQKKAIERESSMGAEKPAPPVQEKPVVSGHVPPARNVQIYGGHDEAWWRSSFKGARGELDALQSRLGEKKESLSALHRKRVIFQRSRDRVAYNDLADDIAHDEETLKDLQERLAALDAEAEKAGVPPGWRQ